MYKEFIGYFVMGMAATLIITKSILKWLIPKLKSVKLGQKILDIGPRWHKNKEGTPTMGGLSFIAASLIMFIFLIVFASLRGQIQNTAKLIICMAFALLNGLIGVLDDYTKFFKKQNEGLSAGVKFLLQLVVAGAFLFALGYISDFSTTMYFPFVDKVIDLKYGYYAISLILITGIVNSVNLTDGIDGLASTVTFFVGCFFAIAAVVAKSYDTVIISSLLVGATAGFLVYNLYPAKIFMGDTGSLYLGGMVVALGYIIDNPLITLVVGVIYLCEALSDIIQVIGYKLTGKRVFKMAPIHHHFEKCGWSENKIVAVFSSVTVVFCIAAYFGM